MIETVHVPYAPDGAMLAVHRHAGARLGPPVLYVHGATFPSTLAVFWRFDKVSWADALASAGFDAWGFDFLGYGQSSRYPGMQADPRGKTPLGRADEAAKQIEAVVNWILAERGERRVSLVAHSWGTMAAGLYAGTHPHQVDQLVFFGPFTRRKLPDLPDSAMLGGWRPITVAEQWKRFTEDVPAGLPPVLLERHFKPWAKAYLASDTGSAARTPPAVATPSGPMADIAAAWSGRLAYDAARILAPVLIVRGEWDSLVNDADAAWLRGALSRAPEVQDVKIPQGTHLLHLEENRHALHAAVNAFLTLPHAGGAQ